MMPQHSPTSLQTRTVSHESPDRPLSSNRSLSKRVHDSSPSSIPFDDEFGKEKTRRVNPYRLAERLGPELVAELEAFIYPGAKMPSYSDRKVVQDRYSVDRRHIYDYLHSRGLRVAKEDRHLNLHRNRMHQQQKGARPPPKKPKPLPPARPRTGKKRSPPSLVQDPPKLVDDSSTSAPIAVSPTEETRSELLPPSKRSPSPALQYPPEEACYEVDHLGSEQTASLSPTFCAERFSWKPQVPSVDQTSSTHTDEISSASDYYIDPILEDELLSTVMDVDALVEPPAFFDPYLPLTHETRHETVYDLISSSLPSGYQLQQPNASSIPRIAGHQFDYQPTLVPHHPETSAGTQIQSLSHPTSALPTCNHVVVPGYGYREISAMQTYGSPSDQSIGASYPIVFPYSLGRFDDRAGSLPPQNRNLTQLIAPLSHSPMENTHSTESLSWQGRRFPTPPFSTL